MEKRILGTTGIKVSPIAIGSNVFGWTVDESQSQRLLDDFVERGLTFIDTADVYSAWVPGNKGGESETIIGNWLKSRGNRSELVIATKVGSEVDGKKGLSRTHIFEAVEASLRRLQTDYIDLYQAHYPDPSTPIEETLEAFEQLIKEGKIRAIGASNYSPAQLTEALEASKRTGLTSYATFQPEYNLYDRAGFEKDFEQICLDNDLAVINYYALASGFLTGKYRSEADFGKSQRGGGMKKYVNDRGLRILDALDEVAHYYDTKPAVVALAWLLAKPVITAPIASATKSEQIEDMARATELELTSENIEFLDAASMEA